MHLSESYIRKLIRRVLLEKTEEGTVDVDQVKQDAGVEMVDALEAPDPHNPDNSIGLAVVDNKVKIFIKPQEGDEQEIPPDSEEWHNGLAAIIEKVEGSTDESAKEILKTYIESMFPQVKDQGKLQNLLSRYKMLFKTT